MIQIFAPVFILGLSTLHSLLLLKGEGGLSLEVKIKQMGLSALLILGHLIYIA